MGRLRRLGCLLSVYQTRGICKCERRIQRVQSRHRKSGILFGSEFMRAYRGVYFDVIYPPSYDQLLIPVLLGINIPIRPGEKLFGNRRSAIQISKNLKI
jgi:hypothetical protein